MNKKILVPLATLAAAGAIVVGSGATFTSSTGNTISSATSGTLNHTNSKNNQAIFTLADIKPGDTRTGGLSLTNTGSLPATFSLTETASTNGFTGENLKLQITDVANSKVVYNGTFGGLVDGEKQDLGEIAPGATHGYTFVVSLAENTPNADQGKTANATYKWDSVQLDGKSTTY